MDLGGLELGENVFDTFERTFLKFENISAR